MTSQWDKQGDTHGGPYQYLAHHLGLGQKTDDGAEVPEAIMKQNDFIQYLVNVLPMQDTVAYSEDTKLDGISSDEEMANNAPHCAWACIMLETCFKN